MQFILRHRGRSAFLLVFSLLLIYTVYAAQAKDFWTDAAQMGMAEVALGSLAVEKAQNEQVKQFGQRMVQDHTASNEELKSLAAAKNVELPAGPSAKQTATRDKLSGLSGAEFDREFMKAMVKSHEAAVKLYDRQAKRDTDAEAKTFAAKHLPALQAHLRSAESIYSSVRQNGRSGNNNSGGNSSAAPHSNSNGNMH